MTIICTLVALAILLKNGWIVTFNKVRFFGFHFDVYNFDQLSGVIEYANVSRIVNSQHRLEAKDIDQFTLIHIGWAFIADAYLERFHEYPSDDSLNTHANKLGSQNLEFIRVFRRAYNASSGVYSTSKIRKDFAFEYFDKSTGLAERITTGGGKSFNVNSVVEKKLRAAGYDGNFEILGL